MWQPQRPSFDRLASAIDSLDLAEDAWMRGILAAVRKDCGGARDAFVGLGELENGRPRPLQSVGTDDELASEAPDGHCVHSDDPAAAGRAALRDSIRRVERSRSRFRDKPVAIDARQPLVDGRWILCDQFDADGKHFVVAYVEKPEPRRPTALSDRETRVVELMISGWALKRIAYHLGLSEGAVASYAHRACTKLGVRRRVALAEAFARSRASGVQFDG